jgi:predicted nucleotidyltransferase component of viral defense system
MELLNPLQLREIFHLEYLRWLGRKLKAEHYALKGGVNLRFFFRSIRYSEDMHLDIQNIKVESLKDTAMKILSSDSFQDNLKPFGIERVIPPDITKAKQTQTTQRFKAHLMTFAGEDLFTKIEFSRRGISEGVVVQPILGSILRTYKLPPLLVPHYNVHSTIIQKINALASRTIIQARDIFDLYALSSQYEPSATKNKEGITENKLSRAYENIFEVSFEQFRDTVLAYLPQEEQPIYNSSSAWDEVKLKVANFINELKKEYA